MEKMQHDVRPRNQVAHLDPAPVLPTPGLPTPEPFPGANRTVWWIRASWFITGLFNEVSELITSG